MKLTILLDMILNGVEGSGDIIILAPQAPKLNFFFIFDIKHYSVIVYQIERAIMQTMFSNLPADCIHHVLCYYYSTQPDDLLREISQTRERDQLLQVLYDRMFEIFDPIYVERTMKAAVIGLFSAIDPVNLKRKKRIIQILFDQETTYKNSASKIKNFIKLSEVKHAIRALDHFAIMAILIVSGNQRRLPSWMRGEGGGFSAEYAHISQNIAAQN